MSSLSEAAESLQGRVEAELQRVNEAYGALDSERRQLEEREQAGALRLEEARQAICAAQRERREAEEAMQELEAERKDIEKLRASVHSEQAAWEEEKRVMGELSKPLDDVVKINAGGTVFLTRRSTLCQLRDSALAAMFSGRWECNLKHDESGAVFLDASPGAFEVVLTYLRAKAMNPGAAFPTVPPFLQEEVAALLAFLGLTHDEEGALEVPKDRSVFNLTHVSGHFCGGTVRDFCEPSVHYTWETMERILLGTVPPEMGRNSQAIYTYPGEGEHVLCLAFPRPYKISGCQVMIARRSECRWRVFVDDAANPTYCKTLFASLRASAPVAQDCILTFDQAVEATTLRIVIDQCMGNIGFRGLAFF
mmetsp:Transcript_22180/g.61433  ORF Transcript_22180/g.61433 Transcript_22180/m.61433 type:complete len:365 (-) Transcript_22180:126-1220(-)